MAERRMSGYYYGFDETGCESVDVLLSAVACAGKAFHHTEEWNNESDHPDLEPYEECHRGKTPEAWIQNAAVDAAQAFKDAVEKARAEGEAAGRTATLAPLIRYRDFDRAKEAELRKLADAGDLNARGQAYEHELRADFVDELIAECEESAAGKGQSDG